MSLQTWEYRNGRVAIGHEIPCPKLSISLADQFAPRTPPLRIPNQATRIHCRRPNAFPIHRNHQVSAPLHSVIPRDDLLLTLATRAASTLHRKPRAYHTPACVIHHQTKITYQQMTPEIQLATTTALKIAVIGSAVGFSVALLIKLLFVGIRRFGRK